MEGLKGRKRQPSFGNHLAYPLCNPTTFDRFSDRFRRSTPALEPAGGGLAPLSKLSWICPARRRGLDLQFSRTGPKVLWEVERGKEHAVPLCRRRLRFVHRVDKNGNMVRCLDAATGTAIWGVFLPGPVSRRVTGWLTLSLGPVIDLGKLVYTLR